MRFTIVSRIYRPEPSAASLYLGSVSDALIQAGHEVTVITAKPLKAHAAAGDGSRGEVILVFPVLRNRDGYLRGYLQYLSFDLPLIFRLLFAKKPSAILVEPPPTTGAVVRVICWIRRIPYVYNAADIWSDAAGGVTSSSLVVKLLRWIETFAIRGATRIATVSDGVASRLRELGISKPTTTAGFGADTEVFHYEVSGTIRPEFIYAGTHAELQGAEILIPAFASFLTTHPGYRLRFIGNAVDRESMRSQAELLDLSESITFEESIPPDTLRVELSMAVATLATLRPGNYDYAFATKIYSSLATGCPVIFAGPGPTHDFIEAAPAALSAGIAVPYMEEHIANAMREIADNQLSNLQRKAIAEWVAEEHSMQKVAAGVVPILIAAAKEPSHD